MNGRSTQFVLGSLLLSVVTAAGCAARPDMSRTSAPAPGGASGSTAGQDANGSAMVAAAERGDGGGMAASSSAEAMAAARPAVKDYAATADLPDVHFDFDRYDIRADAARILEKSATWLKANPSYHVLIEGHADERGTNEYNLALGDRRAKATLNYLASHGVTVDRLAAISYGEERGLCKDPNEGCWAKNRRAHFSVKSR